MYSSTPIPFFPTTWTTIAAAFLAGVVTTIVAVIVISSPGSPSIHILDSWTRRRRNEPIMILHRSTKSTDLEGDQLPTKRPFEFRSRLWNEPPELDYSAFEHYDAVQKAFKDIGGKELLEWRTRVLDLWTEEGITDEYLHWIETTVGNDRGFQRGDAVSEGEKRFYEGLHRNLKMDHKEIMREERELNKRCRKTRQDISEMVILTNELINRETAKLRE